eukprot:8103599-Pyramimonas_sp.AAC.1
MDSQQKTNNGPTHTPVPQATTAPKDSATLNSPSHEGEDVRNQPTPTPAPTAPATGPDSSARPNYDSDFDAGQLTRQRADKSCPPLTTSSTDPVPGRSGPNGYQLPFPPAPVSYTHLRAHETGAYL